MAIQVQLRRGTAAQNNAFTGAIGELSFDTTANQVRIHNGSDAGGFKIGVGNFPTGTNNVALGNTPLDSLDASSPGGNNTGVGHDALTATTTGSDLVAVGKDALKASTTASNNVAVGSGALATSTTATDNTAVGYQALNANTSGADNVALGDEAGHDITTGSRNTILGSKAGDAATTTDDSTLVGYGAGGGAIMTGHDNTGIGSNALSATSSGSFNTAVGKDAGLAISTGANNVAVGFEALKTEDGNGNTTAIGYRSLKTQNAGAEAYNVAVGIDAGTGLTTGISNTLIGGFSGGGATITGASNTAVGRNSLYVNTSGANNVAIGAEALTANTTATGGTAVGYQAGLANTTGVRNAWFGYQAGKAAVSAADNLFVGYHAGILTTGSNNCHVGTLAGQANVAAASTTYIGTEAGFSSTGNANTFVGRAAGYHMTSGANNTILGRFSGNASNLDNRTQSNTIVISDGSGQPRLQHNGGSYWFSGNQTAQNYWPAVASASGKNAVSFNTDTGALGVTTNDVVYINRNLGDSNLVLFYSAGVNHGGISVSGSTVSFNGGHLARWSQLTDGSKDNTLLKGTVMTNLDQMAVWEYAAVAEGDEIKTADGNTTTATADDVADAYTENNEQLNCMAVSSEEGDANVAGVFVNWDKTDDGYNDMNIAMTGDMVIRIAKGVTLARGDLLMSAGDGTAKPQDDDIVRSKTIAKVTSTNVSHTYDDKSFLVPCVLMAC